MGVPESRPVADFLPTISIKAKDVAAEMTSVNIEAKDLNGVSTIEKNMWIVSVANTVDPLGAFVVHGFYQLHFFGIKKFIA